MVIDAFFGGQELGGHVIDAGRDGLLAGPGREQNIQPFLRGRGPAEDVQVVIQRQHDRADVTPLRGGWLHEGLGLAATQRTGQRCGEAGHELGVRAAVGSVGFVPPQVEKAPAAVLSVKTAEATSQMRYRLITSRQTRLRVRSPPTASVSNPTAEACRRKVVHRLTGVAYFALIRAGNSVTQGTSASGAEPTSVTGSVSSPDDPKYLTLDLEFATAGQAEAFASFLHEHVWSSPASSPAPAGPAQTRILDLRPGGQSD
ncbi:MAG TPA: hypothetical protein VE464_12535 [Streptosporangiaceae bacterium]|nr:hypothetical protein [Streptosporangiaceae bacterium]